MNKKIESKEASQDTVLLSLRQNDIRAFVCCAAGAALLMGISWPNIITLSSFIALCIFIYAITTYIWLRFKAKNHSVQSFFSRIMAVDALLIGVVVSYIGFNLLPSILFFTMVQFNSLFNGGIKKWAIDNFAFVVGATGTFLLSSPKLVFSNTLEINTVSLIGVIVYFCAYALYAYSRNQKLENANERLKREKLDQKLRTYKLARYLTPTVWRAITEGREDQLAAERKRVTVFFSDIQGFSALSEELEAETLAEILNSYLNEMNKIATKNRGTIDKFMGDGVMILFGDNKSEGIKKDCLRCLAMAVEMRRKMKELQATWLKLGVKKPLQIRMGINTGYCTVGSFGTNHYMDYTVLGTHVNLASRLESAADPGEILLSHESWSLVKDVVMCRDKGEIIAKGFAHPIKVYQVVDFRKDLGRQQNYFEENLEGFSIHLDLDKLKNYDKSKIVTYLQKISERIKDKIG